MVTSQRRPKKPVLFSDLRFDLVATVVSNLNPDLVKFVDRTFDRYMLKPLERLIGLVRASHSQGMRIVCNTQSVCVLVSHFINQLYETRLEQHKKEAAAAAGRLSTSEGRIFSASKCRGEN